jgi:hypothetical protein
VRHSARTITTIVFLVILLACGITILALGTSTGLIFGGAKTVTATTTTTTPMYAQVGWLRNTSPWPVTITSIRANAVNAAKAPTVYVEEGHDSSSVAVGKTPLWVKSADPLPYRLVGGDIRFLGFGILPQADQIAAFRSITVSFVGPLGFHFTKTFGGTDIAAASPTLPAGLIATNPANGVESLNGYIALLRSGLSSNDPATMEPIVGPKATAAQASAVLAREAGYTSDFKVVAKQIGEQPTHVQLTFYKTDPTKDALAPITVTWSNYRWSVDPIAPAK